MSGPAIAKACGVSPATMRRRLNALMEAGHVVTNGGKGKARRYSVTNGQAPDTPKDGVLVAQD
jgi:predicted ArsR family transcriptional regulator